MRNSKIIVSLLLLMSSLWAEESQHFLNALGWDNGGSYKRYLPHKLWIGLTIGGNWNAPLESRS